MKIIITETQSKSLLKRIRRIQELRDSIEYQAEVHNVCNFDDGNEFAEFCVEEGLRFFYGDEDHEREDDIFADEDENEDNGRTEITQLMNDEYYEEFVSLWDARSYDCDDDNWDYLQ